MNNKSKIVNESSLYFVEGFDGYNYIIKLDSLRNYEAKVPADTFNVIRTSVKRNLELYLALQLVSPARSSEKILNEIDKLVQGGVIILA